MKASHIRVARPAVLLLLLLLAACGGRHAAALATARPTTTVEQTAAADAKALFAHCIPAGATGQLALLTSKTARDKVLTCGGVPVGHTAAGEAARKTAEACALNAVEHGGKLPPGRQAKEGKLLTEIYPCVKQYQAGVNGGTPAATAAGTPAPSGSGK